MNYLCLWEQEKKLLGHFVCNRSFTTFLPKILRQGDLFFHPCSVVGGNRN